MRGLQLLGSPDPLPAPRPSPTPWYSRRNCWNSGRDTRHSSGRSPALQDRGEVPGGQLASVDHGQWGAPQKAAPRMVQEGSPPPPSTVSLRPRESTRGGTGVPGQKPTSPLQTKPQGAGFQERKVHLQETEPGQRKNPGRPHGQGALGKKGWGNTKGVEWGGARRQVWRGWGGGAQAPSSGRCT